VLLTDAQAQEETPVHIPFRGQIWDVDGIDYGYLKEVTCTDEGRITDIVTTDDQHIAPARLLRIGDVVLLKGKKTTPRTRRQPPKSVQKDRESENTRDMSAYFNLPNGNRLRRIAGDYSFLLGRTIKSDLLQRGERVLTQGSVITPELIDLAREKGVLLALTELSR
jgi:hypothetical protein